MSPNKGVPNDLCQIFDVLVLESQELVVLYSICPLILFLYLMDFGSRYLICGMKSGHALCFHIVELGSQSIIGSLKSYCGFCFHILDDLYMLGISTQVEPTLSQRAAWESAACQQSVEHTADWESAWHRIGLGPKRGKIIIIYGYIYIYICVCVYIRLFLCMFFWCVSFCACVNTGT